MELSSGFVKRSSLQARYRDAMTSPDREPPADSADESNAASEATDAEDAADAAAAQEALARITTGEETVIPWDQALTELESE
jgi:hypothetical protein